APQTGRLEFHLIFLASAATLFFLWLAIRDSALLEQISSWRSKCFLVSCETPTPRPHEAQAQPEPKSQPQPQPQVHPQPPAPRPYPNRRATLHPAYDHTSHRPRRICLMRFWWRNVQEFLFAIPRGSVNRRPSFFNRNARAIAVFGVPASISG